MTSAFGSRTREKTRVCSDPFPSYGIALRCFDPRLACRRQRARSRLCLTAGDKITWIIKDF